MITRVGCSCEYDTFTFRRPRRLRTHRLILAVTCLAVGGERGNDRDDHEEREYADIRKLPITAIGQLIRGVRQAGRPLALEQRLEVLVERRIAAMRNNRRHPAVFRRPWRVGRAICGRRATSITVRPMVSVRRCFHRVRLTSFMRSAYCAERIMAMHASHGPMFSDGLAPGMLA